MYMQVKFKSSPHPVTEIHDTPALGLSATDQCCLTWAHGASSVTSWCLLLKDVCIIALFEPSSQPAIKPVYCHCVMVFST